MKKNRNFPLKTFTVPTTDIDISQINVINTNIISNSSKEEIFNQAIKFHLEGNYYKAEKYYRYLIKKGLYEYRVFCNYGEILKKLGKSKEALTYLLEAIKVNSKSSIPFILIIQLLRKSNLSNFDKKILRDTLLLLFERKDIASQELFITFNYLYENELTAYLKNLESKTNKNETLQKIITDELIVKALKRFIFTDIKWEKLLLKIRSHLLYFVSQGNINSYDLNFIIGLAHQCFLNEYIYSFTAQEDRVLHKIKKSLINNEIKKDKISILGCYSALHTLVNRFPLIKSIKCNNKSYNDLIKLQILEPLEEKRLSKLIKQIGLINDEVSKKVMYQYEDNPYPRWLYSNPSKEIKYFAFQRINRSIYPNFITQNKKHKNLKVLVAGCGTGMHILNVQEYKNAHITAIDISRASLAYAKRKLNDLQINNVDLFQMDILELDLLEKKFDIIECSGVLHHMNNPLKGLKKILNRLDKNGHIKLGLYSELARIDVIKAREYILANDLKSNINDIKSFRNDVISEKFSEIKNIKSRPSFYSTSECRDLCFHSIEHRFTIPQLKKIFDTNRLIFHGFILPRQIKTIYKRFYPKDIKQINLNNWARFEEKYPHTFRGMYQFWISKNLLHS